MSAGNKKLIMFDFDGVLVDTLIMHYEMIRKSNPASFSLERFKDIFNGNIFEHVKKSSDVNQPSRFFEEYEDRTREIVIPEIIKSSLKTLSNKYTLSIVSSTTSKIILKILNEAEIPEYFLDVLGSDVHKSKVVKINMLLEKYGIDPSCAIFVTDTTGDVLEARECGVDSIAVLWGFHDKERLEKSNPKVILDDPALLVDSIENVLK